MARLFIGSFLTEAEAERVSTVTSARVHALTSDKSDDLENFNARALPAEKLHITWLFLGEVDDERVKEVSVKLQQTLKKLGDMAPLEITYDELEIWPEVNRARVAVVTPSLPPPEVQTIAAAIRKELGQFQEQDESKEFKPHVTLFRFSPAANLKDVELTTQPEILLPVKQPIRLEDVHLIASAGEYSIIC